MLFSLLCVIGRADGPYNVAAKLFPQRHLLLFSFLLLRSELNFLGMHILPLLQKNTKNQPYCFRAASFG